NFQAAAFDISGKISYSESGGLTIAFGQGNIFGFGAGTSEFAGVQWNSNNGFGLQLSGSVNGANGAAISGNVTVNFAGIPDALSNAANTLSNMAPDYQPGQFTDPLSGYPMSGPQSEPQSEPQSGPQSGIDINELTTNAGDLPVQDPPQDLFGDVPNLDGVYNSADGNTGSDNSFGAGAEPVPYLAETLNAEQSMFGSDPSAPVNEGGGIAGDAG